MYALIKSPSPVACDDNDGPSATTEPCKSQDDSDSGRAENTTHEHYDLFADNDDDDDDDNEDVFNNVVNRYMSKRNITVNTKTIVIVSS